LAVSIVHSDPSAYFESSSNSSSPSFDPWQMMCRIFGFFSPIRCFRCYFVPI
jgi:hypothetical protein